MSDVFRVAITGLNPDTDTEETLWFEDGPGASLTPSETPANVFVDGRLSEVPSLRREMSTGGTLGGAARISVGTLKLHNLDGALDYLRDWAFDGRDLTVYWTDDPDAVFPGGWRHVQTVKVRKHTVGVEWMEIEMRDALALVDVPLQSELYAGDNVPPDGLEGGESLEAKPKPLVFGAAFNVPATPVNDPKLIYQVSGEPVNSIPVARDRGKPLTGGMQWTERSVAGSTVQLAGVAFGDDRWVVVGGAEIHWSDDDGANWTAGSPASGSFTFLRGVIRAFGLFIAFGGSTGSELWTSPNGETWTARTSGFGSDPIRAGAHDPALGVAVLVGNGGKISSSTTGTSWAARTSGTAADLLAVAGARRRFTAFGILSGDAVAVTSGSGTTWTGSGISGVPLDFGAFGLAAEPGRWIAIGYEIGAEPARLMVSEDGLAWSQRDEYFAGVTDAAAGSIAAAAIGPSRTVAVGNFGFVGSAERGSEVFVRHTNPATVQQLHAVGFGNGTFMAVGGSGSGAPTVLVAAKPSTYASESDLLDDTLRPASGTYRSFAAGGYFRLGGNPDTPVTADAVQGASAADRTAAQYFVWILTKLGMTAGDWSAADVTALDAAWDAVLGDYQGTQEIRATEKLTLAAKSALAWWGADKLGVYRIKRLVDPATVSADIVLGPEMIPVYDFRVLDQPLPAWKATVRYGRNFHVLDQDVAGIVSEAMRVRLRTEWLETVASDTDVHDDHKLATRYEIDTALTVQADAASLAASSLALLSPGRQVVEFSVPYTSETLDIDLGTVAEVHTDRVGFEAGKNVLIRAIDPNSRTRQLRLTAWG